MAWRPGLDASGYKAPGLRRYLGNRGRLCPSPGLVGQSSPGAVCDPFGIARSPFDTFQGPGRGVSFHPARLGRCRQTDTSRGSCLR